MVHVRTSAFNRWLGAESRREAGPAARQRQVPPGNHKGGCGWREKAGEVPQRVPERLRLRTQKLWRAGVRYGAAKEVRFWFA